MPKKVTTRRAKSSKEKRGMTRASGRGSKKNGEVKALNLTAQDKKYLEQFGNQLSPTTKRAKWIHSPREHEDRTGQSLATRNHDVIQHWAEERNAQPATVPGTEHGDTLGVLRFDFAGYGGSRLEKVNWESWFKTFDRRKLAFVFQEHKKDGHMSNFFRLDSPLRERG